MYDYGQCVPQDDVEACKWLNLATIYAEAHAAVAERLTPEQRAECQKLSREWFAARPRDTASPVLSLAHARRRPTCGDEARQRKASNNTMTTVESTHPTKHTPTARKVLL